MKLKHFIGHGGISIAADVGGDPQAAPIVLLHGGGQTRHSWKNAGRRLVAAGYRVIVPDLRGHGDSAWSPDGHYALESLAEDLRALVATLPAPPVLIGASLGGLTALMAAGGAVPVPARALVLVDVTPRMNEDGVGRVLAFMSAHPDGFADIDAAADAVAHYLPHRPRPSSTAGLAKNLRQRHDGRFYWHWDPRLLSARGDDRASDWAKLSACAARLTLPVLLLRGARSELVDEEHVRELLSLVPHARAVLIDDAHHMVAGDDNDNFSAAILDFLAADVFASGSAMAPPCTAQGGSRGHPAA
ncbi:MAG: alpha/beta fold hydrolase [Rhodocyclaceae bacterium]|nr:alpha/beta fold hydrolase [Rhodocyclaceae bacterium]